MAGLSAKSANGGEIEEVDGFKRFDVVADASDHYFVNLNQNEKGVLHWSTNGGTTVHKKIMKEWKILKKHLPDTIFVRVYETRIDLLRAVIVGTVGTPYHDGLFFFDIAFPPDYPICPPNVYYCSYGLRLNPNLYANGRVCLSLLNTWTGRKNERWNPSESTILQVLLSIQALVLNEKPYFNEPGHGMFGRSRVEKKSQAYNEEVFVLSCKTMNFLIRRPPKNFEAFVFGHFCQRALSILRACEAYTNGRVRVGYFRIEGTSSSSSSSSVIYVSEKFKRLMEQLYPQLVLSFKRSGASLGDSVEQLTVEKRKTATPKPMVPVKNKDSIVKKVIEKFTKVLRLKKIKEEDQEIKAK